jgi:hypothetical protein
MPDIEYRFGTGQGEPNVHHSEANVDVDSDGVADGVALDFDGDGRVDDVMWDSDGDGIADTALLDLNDDGTAESAYNDPTGMGTWNAKGQGGNAEPAPAEPPPAQPQQPRSADPAPGDPKPFDPDPADPGGEQSEYEPYESTDDDPEGLFDDLLDDADGREEWYEELER